MEQSNAQLAPGRPRPSYKAIEIRCPGCGAALTQKDEHTELIVCDYCASHIDLSGTERTVLGKGPDQKWKFSLNLGDSFTWESYRYEILARLVYIEEDDEEDEEYITREYLLYNPRKGTMYLSEYEGSYSLSRDVHIMPKEKDALYKDAGSRIRTYDGQSWTAEESGQYTLAYVDGALPWKATVGDRITYAEFTNGEKQYEIQQIENEIEYGMGRELSSAELSQALGRNLSSAKAAMSDARKASKSRGGMKVHIALLILVLMANVFFLINAGSRGEKILTQVFSQNELNSETFSQSFTIDKKDEIIKIKARSDLDNAWMVYDIAIIEGEDKLVHVYDNDLSYYHGVEDGESWSEGSRSGTTYIKIPEPGSYRLMVHAVSATGNTEQAEKAKHQLQITVYKGVLVTAFIFSSMSLTIIIIVITLLTSRIRKA